MRSILMVLLAFKGRYLTDNNISPRHWPARWTLEEKRERIATVGVMKLNSRIKLSLLYKFNPCAGGGGDGGGGRGEAVMSSDERTALLIQ